MAATPSPSMRPGVVTACCVSWKSDQACNVTDGHVLRNHVRIHALQSRPRADTVETGEKREARRARTWAAGVVTNGHAARATCCGAACHAGTPASICRRRVSSRIRCSRMSAACSIALRRSRVGSRGATGMFGMPTFLVEFGRGLHVLHRVTLALVSPNFEHLWKHLRQVEQGSGSCHGSL